MHENDHVVAFIDVLGSSDILLNGTDEERRSYGEGIRSMYESMTDVLQLANVKCFSDNILIYTEGKDPDDVDTVIEAISSTEYHLLVDHGLLLRGGVVVDTLDHVPLDADDFLIGRAVVKAHDLESREAVHPRVVVSNEILDLYSQIPHESSYMHGDETFVNYLEATKSDGFVNTE